MINSEGTPELYDEIHTLTFAVLSGDADDAQRLRLEQLVSASDDARRLYVQYIDETVRLQGGVRPRIDAPTVEHDVVDTPARSASEGLNAGRAGEDRISVTRSIEGQRDQESGNRGQQHFLTPDSCPLTPRNVSSVDVSGIEELADEGFRQTDENDVARERPSRAPSLARRAGDAGTNAPGFRRFVRWLVANTLVGFVAACLLVGVYANVWLARPAEPQRVARIVEVLDAGWTRDGAAIAPKAGDWLVGGRYALHSGMARIVFPWGTEVTLEAPTEIVFSPEGQRQLISGQLVAKVSAEDTGFTIDTPTVEVIDLGTEFGLSTSPGGESEVHVFKGAVEARQKLGDASNPGNPIRLSAGEATGFGIREAPVMPIAFNPKRFSRAWRVSSRVADTKGAVRFVHPPPASVVEGQTESSETMLLFLEAESVRLPEPIAVTMTEPGLHTAIAGRATWLPAGLRVDSYLVHFDPAGSEIDQIPVTLQGTVTFNRPILGLIARGDQLAASDNVLAASGTRYAPPATYQRCGGDECLINRVPPYSLRGFSGLWNGKYPEHSPAPNDWVQLSADRHTLTIGCSAGGEADQLRVLVIAADDDEPSAYDARPVRSPQPYHGRPHRPGDTIEAEHFDLGGDGIAYHDDTHDALANIFRVNESVELYGYLFPDRAEVGVCLASAGEWLAYTVEIGEPGTYMVKTAVASTFGGGTFRFDFGDATSTAPLRVPVTRQGLTTHASQIVDSSPVRLEAGRHVMRIVMQSNNDHGWVGDFDWFRIERAPVALSRNRSQPGDWLNFPALCGTRSEDARGAISRFPGKMCLSP